MRKLKIKKSIEIDAPKEKVWEILLGQKTFKKWASAFKEGAWVETDWNAGSKAYFKEPSGRGMVSEIISHHPNEFVLIEHRGILEDGEEDFESQEARKWIGARESYQVTEAVGTTTLTIEQDAPAEDADWLSNRWEQALVNIKSLSESRFER